MGRKRIYAPLDVYMNRRKVGQYFRDPDGAFAFTYAADWLEWENTLPISRSLPLRPDRYVGPPVIAVFENLLPDSDDICRRVAERVGADGVDAYSLLARIGRDCVGALQFLPEGEVPEASNVLTGEPLSGAQIAAMLKDLRQTPLGIRREQDFRISVAGAQEKTALLLHDGQWIESTGTTPTTHILKPEPPRLYWRAKLSENCPLWNRIRNQYRIPQNFANARWGCSWNTVPIIGTRLRRWSRSQANWAVRRIAFASGAARFSAMVAKDRGLPVLRRRGSRSWSVKCVSFDRPPRY